MVGSQSELEPKVCLLRWLPASWVSAWFRSLRPGSKLLTNRTKESVRANAGNQCACKARTGYQGRKGSAGQKLQGKGWAASVGFGDAAECLPMYGEVSVQARRVKVLTGLLVFQKGN